jgi:large subunit ribosomal protein L7/L12
MSRLVTSRVFTSFSHSFTPRVFSSLVPSFPRRFTSAPGSPDSTPQIDFPSPDGVEKPSPRVERLIQELMSLTIFEGLQLAKALEKKWGVPAPLAMAAPAAAAQPAAVAAPKEEKAAKAAEPAAPTTFSVRLDSFNAADKIKVIKEVRAATGLGLKESKDLVEGAPKVVKKDLNKADCDALVAKLKEAGAKVTVE